MKRRDVIQVAGGLIAGEASGSSQATLALMNCAQDCRHRCGWQNSVPSCACRRSCVSSPTGNGVLEARSFLEHY